MPGLFITVEGGEGVGKSTFCASLGKELERHHRNVLLTREPGGTHIAQKIRELFLTPPPEERLLPLTELFLVSAARSQHVHGPITQALTSAHGAVVCDRFYDSTRVYQGILGGNPSATLELILAASVAGVEPQVTFLLDCPVDLCLERIQARASQVAPLNRYDGGSRGFHERLRQAYLDVAGQFPHRMVVLDASKPAAEVVADAVAVLTHRGLLP